MSVVASWEFDHHGTKGVSRVELREHEGNLDVWVCSNLTERRLIESDRDQWGVYVGSSADGGICVAQEDGTRSFLDAMIQALTELRRQTEYQTQPATQTLAPVA